MINSKGGFSEMDYTAVYTPGKYPNITKNFSGNQTDVNYSASIYANYGWRVTVKHTDSLRWYMTAELNQEVGSDGVTPISTTGSYVTKNWDFEFDTTEKELLHLDTTDTWLLNIDSKDRVTLDRLISSPPSSGSIDWSPIIAGQGVNWSLTDVGAPFSGSTTSSLAACQTVWALTYNGVKTFPIVQQKIVLTMQVPQDYNLTVFTQNVGRIYAKASVDAELGVQSNYYAAMSQGTDPTYGILCPQGSYIPLLYGWRKMPPQLPKQGSIINATIAFQYGLWAQNVYGVRI